MERGHDLVLRWLPIGDLADLPLVPEVPRSAIGQLRDGLQHVVRVDSTD